MARIRSIKPEFPQSESMGRVSRDARLLFIQLWPICDDSGRTRAASRMLASTLFPYDEDAVALLPGWLDELEREGCIERYEVDGKSFIQVCNWLSHQKIDKPSAPKFPSPLESSRAVQEGSALEGKGREGKGEEEKAPTDTTKKPKGGREEITFSAWLASLPEDADAIPASDPVFTYAVKAGIPLSFLDLSWAEFSRRMASSQKRYRSWPQAYRNYVENNYLNLWRVTPDGDYVLTTAGVQAKKVAA